MCGVLLLFKKKRKEKGATVLPSLFNKVPWYHTINSKFNPIFT